MSLRLWDTREPLDPAFAARWTARLSRAPHAHFALDPACLAWEASRGRHALAALVDEDGRAAALVLRVERGAFVSGWPWRGQMVVEDPAREGAVGLSPSEAEWLCGHASRLSASRRLECFTPHAPPRAVPGYAAGATTVRAMQIADEEILKSLDTNKRRLIKRAGREGFEVAWASGLEDLRAFARLQCETEARRGERAAVDPADTPPPGVGFREWEHPWMMLLIARRGGVIEAGSGFGFYPSGMMDYRANASTLEAKKSGANVLLAFEALRRGRDRGCRWMNWGGVTEFKREMGGERVEMSCWLGGGAVWAVPNQLHSTLRASRPRLAAWWRNLRGAALRRPA